MNYGRHEVYKKKIQEYGYKYYERLKRIIPNKSTSKFNIVLVSKFLINISKKLTAIKY